MKVYFCEEQNDYFCGSGDEIDELSDETLKQWARRYPPRHANLRRYFDTEEDRLALAKGNTARRELSLREKHRHWLLNSWKYESY